MHRSCCCMLLRYGKPPARHQRHPTVAVVKSLMSALSLPYHSAILGSSKRRALMEFAGPLSSGARKMTSSLRRLPKPTVPNRMMCGLDKSAGLQGNQIPVSSTPRPPRLPLAVQMWFQLAKPARVPLLLARSVVGLLAGHLRPDNEGKTLLSLEVCFSLDEPDMNENGSLFLYSVPRAFIPFIQGLTLADRNFHK